MYKVLENQNAVAVLPVILLIGGIIIEIGVAGAFIAYYLTSSGLGVKLSEEALAGARSGIEDALIKITRNKDFTSATPYNLKIGNADVQVTVLRDIPIIGKVQINSLGSVKLKRRQLQAVINMNSINGEFKIESLQEISL